MINKNFPTENIKNDIQNNLNKFKVFFETKDRFDKKKELSGLDIFEGIMVSFDLAFSLKKTWDNFNILISEAQKPQPAISQNKAPIPVYFNGMILFINR